MANQDRRHQDNGQGDVKDPAHDRRLKQNRDQEAGRSGGQQAGGGDEDREPGGQGRVKDPEHDGRLKENRDRGVHKGDA